MHPVGGHEAGCLDRPRGASPLISSLAKSLLDDEDICSLSRGSAQRRRMSASVRGQELQGGDRSTYGREARHHETCAYTSVASFTNLLGMTCERVTCPTGARLSSRAPRSPKRSIHMYSRPRTRALSLIGFSNKSRVWNSKATSDISDSSSPRGVRPLQKFGRSACAEVSTPLVAYCQHEPPRPF